MSSDTEQQDSSTTTKKDSKVVEYEEDGNPFNSLKWKKVDVKDELFMGFTEGGFLCFEELEDYPDTLVTTGSSQVEGEGKKKKKNKKKKKAGENQQTAATTVKKVPADAVKAVPKEKSEAPSAPPARANKQEAPAMSTWSVFGLHPSILRALKDLGFSEPTPIQRETLSATVAGRKDVVGAAETGSGKTLAFALPIVHHIQSNKDAAQELSAQEEQVSTPAKSPVQSPGKGKALREMLKQKLEAKRKQKEQKGAESEGEETMEVEEKEAATEKQGPAKRANPLSALVLVPTRELGMQVTKHIKDITKYNDVKVLSLVGGIAEPKQLRLLKQRPDIIVATPGRCWELISQGTEHISDLRSVKYVVVDEADRMVAEGHFPELENILRFMYKLDSAESFEGEEKPEEEQQTKKPMKRQTFLFSATLNLSEKFREFKRKQRGEDKSETIDKLFDVVKFTGKPKVVDLTSEHKVAKKLEESKIDCLDEDKDLYLYYFLARYPGRTLIFCNSVDAVRHVNGVLAPLQVDCFPLHATMQTRQRLKNVERFRDRDNCVLIATDVAARGLDIPDVKYVLHFQLPRSPEVYIHRCGRTARASNSGFSVALVGPEDQANYRTICKALSKDDGIPFFPVELEFLPAVRQRLALAKKLDIALHSMRKERSEKDWMVKNAREADILLDDDDEEDQLDVDEDGMRKSKKKNLEVQKMRNQMDELLKQPLVPKGVSKRYLTSSLLDVSTLGPAAPTTTASEVMSTKNSKRKERDFDLPKKKGAQPKRQKTDQPSGEKSSKQQNDKKPAGKQRPAKKGDGKRPQKTQKRGNPRD